MKNSQIENSWHYQINFDFNFNFIYAYSDKENVKKLSALLNFMIFLLVVTIGATFYYFKSTSGVKTVSPTLSAEQLDELVNTHLKKTVQQNQLTKIMNEKALFENRTKRAAFERQRKAKEDKEITKIPATSQIWKDEQKANGSTPTQVINEVLNENTDYEKMIATEKKEYARQWIENARKEGYLLELSPELEVIKYTPIRKPSQQEDSTEAFPSD